MKGKGRVGDGVRKGREWGRGRGGSGREGSKGEGEG